MKAVSNPRNQKPNTSRKADVKLTLNLTAEQFDRFDVIARMAGATPENLVVALAFTEIDSWESWSQLYEDLDRSLAYYTEYPAEASTEEPGQRLEDGAPERLKKMVGYESPEVAGTQEVAHV